MRAFASVASALAVIAPLVSAQTTTDCDPLTKTCPNDPGLNQADYTVDFTNGLPKDWTALSGTVDATPNGGRFRMAAYGDAPTIESNFAIFFGRVEALVQAAPGQGIVSSVVLQSADRDEIDWEWIGSETTRVQSNYFGKGNDTTFDRGGFHDVSAPATSWHKYAIDYSPSTVTWSIDGNVVRTLNYADAVGGKNFPQTPMRIRIGPWIAGNPTERPGTVTWAGGMADMSKGPYDMLVKTVTIHNANPGTAYKYTDNSGSSSSIQIINGGSTSNGPSAGGAVSNVVGSSGSSGSSSSSSSSGSTGGSASASASSAPTVTSAANGTNILPSAKPTTATIVKPSATPSAKPSTVSGSGAASSFQGQTIGAGLLAVLGLFLAL